MEVSYDERKLQDWKRSDGTDSQEVNRCHSVETDASVVLEREVYPV